MWMFSYDLISTLLLFKWLVSQSQQLCLFGYQHETAFKRCFAHAGGPLQLLYVFLWTLLHYSSTRKSSLIPGLSSVGSPRGSQDSNMPFTWCWGVLCKHHCWKCVRSKVTQGYCTHRTARGQDQKKLLRPCRPWSRGCKWSQQRSLDL